MRVDAFVPWKGGRSPPPPDDGHLCSQSILPGRDLLFGAVCSADIVPDMVGEGDSFSGMARNEISNVIWSRRECKINTLVAENR